MPEIPDIRISTSLIRCKVPVDVMATGVPMIFPEEDALADPAEFSAPSVQGESDPVMRSWQTLIRMLDQQDSSYKS